MSFWSDYPRFLPPDLGRIKLVLKRLGDPHLSLPPVIHVAGTNGKGSVINNLAEIIRAAGQTCHIYTSPHLLNITERIKIKGEEIDEERLKNLKLKVDEASKDIEMTWFDVLTCIAFLAFVENPADFTLLETGLGGRFDATNVVVPILTLIASISMDHQAQLGETLQEIAHEKAGIIKEGVPVIVGPNSAEVKGLLAPYNPVFCGMPSADYIKDNQELARKAALQLGFSSALIEKGLARAKLQARFQQLDETIFLDGAHNEGGAIALGKLIDQFNQDVVLVAALPKNRDIEAFLLPFKGKIQEIIFPDISEDYFHDVQICEDVARGLGFHVGVSAPVDKLYAEARVNTHIITVFTGSLHFAAEVLKVNS